MEKNNVMTGGLCAVASSALFGFSFLFTKDATENVSELSLLGWRFFVAAVVMSLCTAAGIVRINLRGKSLRPLLTVALCSPVIYFIGETFGVSSTTASESGAFIACIPVVSLLASSIMLKKKPQRKQVVGIFITLAGVLITVFAVGTGSSFSLTGYLSLSVAVVSYALYSVNVEKAENYSGEEITLVMLLVGAAVFIAMAMAESILKGNTTELLRLPFTNRSFLAACLYQGIGCSIIAFFLSNVAISKIGVNRTTSFAGVTTLVSVVAGVIILREPFTVFQIIGVVLIIAGVYIANSRLRQ